MDGQKALASALVGAVLLSGCTSGIAGRADRPTYLADNPQSYFADDVEAALEEAAVFKACYYSALGLDPLEPDGLPCGVSPVLPPLTLKTLRNDYAYKMMQAHELALQDFARRLSIEGRGSTFANALAVRGLTAAATIIDNSTTQSILAGVATGLLGIEKDFNQEILAEKAIDFLLVQMAASHLRQRADILSRLDQPVTDYPLAAVELDLDVLSRATSFEVALTEVAAGAEARLQEANEAIRDSRTVITFNANELTPVIDNWLDTADEAELGRRVAAANDWLERENLDVDLFVFISDAETYGDRYRRFVDDLIL